MNPFKNKKKIIGYQPEVLCSFTVYRYEWIDDLNFTIPPEDCLDNAHEYISVVNELFVNAGWEGDGQIELMWIPPFMLPNNSDERSTLGITIWHVKQIEDGISWLLSPAQIPYAD